MQNESSPEIKFDIPINKVESNQDNPRLIFSEAGMQRLVQSIKEVGILVPLTVFRDNDRYIILDGERRWRAAKRINLSTIPCYILPKPESNIEYILNMFKIHNVREEWKLLPTAKKLEQVITQLEAKNGQRISNSELALLTGLSVPTVGRCRKLLTIPEKYQKLLFEEEKLAEQGIEPDKTTLSEDFFLELMGCTSALESKTYGLADLFNKFSKDRIYACFVDKFKSGNIPDITDFRYLTKIIKQTKIPLERRERIITNVLTKQDYRIDEAYDACARPFYESQGLSKQLDRVEVILESLDTDSLDHGSSIVFLNSLENFRKMVDRKIIDIKKKLDQVQPSKGNA